MFLFALILKCIFFFCFRIEKKTKQEIPNKFVMKQRESDEQPLICVEIRFFVCFDICVFHIVECRRETRCRSALATISANESIRIKSERAIWSVIPKISVRYIVHGFFSLEFLCIDLMAVDEEFSFIFHPGRG